MLLCLFPRTLKRIIAFSVLNSFLTYKCCKTGHKCFLFSSFLHENSNIGDLYFFFLYYDCCWWICLFTLSLKHTRGDHFKCNEGIIWMSSHVLCVKAKLSSGGLNTHSSQPNWDLAPQRHTLFLSPKIRDVFHVFQLLCLWRNGQSSF